MCSFSQIFVFTVTSTLVNYSSLLVQRIIVILLLTFALIAFKHKINYLLGTNTVGFLSFAAYASPLYYYPVNPGMAPHTLLAGLNVDVALTLSGLANKLYKNNLKRNNT
ncbi:MAG: hypothetical protein ACJAXH_000798 [Colwellia sp.]|jgi:hypothetical protein